MSRQQNLKQILSFLQTAEKLKALLRHSWLSSGRQESVAEHSWRTALLAMLLAPEIDHKIDICKVLKIIMVHDIAEIYALDHIAWKGKSKTKVINEEKALNKLTASLPKNQRGEITGLWQEYENAKSSEAKFAKAVDKLETVDQHNLADLKTWAEEEYKYQAEHGRKEVLYSKTLQELKKLINIQTRAKIKRK